MNAVNLVPWSKQIELRVRSRAGVWAVALGVYAFAGALCWFVVASRAGADGAALAKELTKLTDESQSLQATSNRLRSEFVSASAMLATAREVGDHPDWGVLFSLLARLRGDAIAFEVCELEPRTSAASTAPATAPGATPGSPAPSGTPKPGEASRGYTLRVGGVGADQRSVAQFVLRLEETGLFNRVSILETRPRADSGDSLIAFRIEAQMQDGAGAPDPRGKP